MDDEQQGSAGEERMRPIRRAVKNRKGRVKGKRLTHSTVGRGRHTVRGKGTIFPVIFKHIYNTLLHMSGGKNTGEMKRSERVLLGEDRE